MSKHHHHHHTLHCKHTRYRQTLWLTVLSAVVNLSLAGIKIVVGKLANSHGLFADGLHSLSDLLTDAMVYYAAKIGKKDADEDHPYGHERFETAGTLFVSLLLVITGLGILLDVVEHLGHFEQPDIHISALVVIVTSILANELLFQVTRFYANRIQSDLLLANAWHHRSDAWSSIVVLLGVVGSYYGYVFCDIIAAIFVALLIVKMGIDISWTSVKELVDTAVEEVVVEQIKSIIDESHGVRALHDLRTRKMGNKILVDVHLIVSPRITVSEGHYIGDQVQQRLRQQVQGIEDVVVHIDAEDDEQFQASTLLPDRDAIESQLQTILNENTPDLEDYELAIHYLNGKLELELSVEARQQHHISRLESMLLPAMQAVLPDLVTIRYYSKLA